MGFFKTLFTGYKIMWNELNTKHNDLIPRMFSGCGTGLMMIGSAVAAKTAMKDDVQKVIAEANAAVEEAKAKREGEQKPERVKRIFKAKAVRGWKVVKAFHKTVIYDAVGATMNGIGLGLEEKGKHKALKAVGVVGAAFASYRANVRDDLGEEADLKYLTGQHAIKRTEKIDRKTGEVTSQLEYIQDDEGFTVKKDPDAFRFWFSEETCPSLWFANRDLTLATLDHIEDTLSLKLQGSGHVSLNDERREFGGLKPADMDVDIGGIFGKVIKPDIPLHKQRVCLHHRDDQDFVEGRTEGCWIIFDTDPDPIVGRIGKKFKQVEK